MRLLLVSGCFLLGLTACSRPRDRAALPPPLPRYDYWLQQARTHPAPARAAKLMPRLAAAFGAEGVPPELAWMAEAESGLDYEARGGSGSRGLFQLTPDAARAIGLSAFLPDERLDPEKSAHAVARRLRILKESLGSWPLALAAYNAGEGRVDRAIAAAHTRYFGIVAENLPASTRRYVPEVLALAAVRGGVPPEKLPGDSLTPPPPHP